MMKEQIRQPGKQESHVIQHKAKAANQTSLNTVLQRYCTVQCESADEEEDILQGKFNNVAQRQEVSPQTPNKTGLPDNLKSGIENLSGYSMDDVRVHYNSSKPAQLQALAYTQGTDIHVAPGQEKHLKHELGHVVQQKRGIVTANTQINNVPVNTNVRLETEADKMFDEIESKTKNNNQSIKSSNVVQRILYVGGKLISSEKETEEKEKEKEKETAPTANATSTTDTTMADTETLDLKDIEKKKELIQKDTIYKFDSYEDLERYYKIKKEDKRFTTNFMNVSQGSSALLTERNSDADKKRFIIDLGPNRENVLAHLKKKKFMKGTDNKEIDESLMLPKLKELPGLITHNHADHTGGSSKIAESFNILYKGSSGEKGDIKEGTLCGLKLKPKTKKGEDENTNSLLSYKIYGNTIFIYPGDLDVSQLEICVGDIEQKEGSFEGKHIVLAASHHGSITGTSEDLLKLFKEADSFIYIVSSGKGNIYEHPHWKKEEIEKVLKNNNELEPEEDSMSEIKPAIGGKRAREKGESPKAKRRKHNLQTIIYKDTQDINSSEDSKDGLGVGGIVVKTSETVGPVVYTKTKLGATIKKAGPSPRELPFDKNIYNMHSTGVFLVYHLANCYYLQREYDQPFPGIASKKEEELPQGTSTKKYTIGDLIGIFKTVYEGVKDMPKKKDSFKTEIENKFPPPLRELRSGRTIPLKQQPCSPPSDK